MVVGKLDRTCVYRSHVWYSSFSTTSKGESGLGKSTLVNTLFNTQLYPPKEIAELTAEVPQTVEIKSTTADIEENGVKLKLTVVDTPGFGDFVNNEERYVMLSFACTHICVI